MSDLRAIHLHIEGRVQGVGFRAFVADEARRRGLAGWVRNRSDGSVEAFAQGDADGIAALAEACGRGPWGSFVRSCRVDSVSPESGMSDFSITSGS